MTISLLTTTANRPVGFGLLELFVRRQTVKPDEWIVADGGTEPVACTLGQTHLHVPAPPGPLNFTANLRRGLAAVTGDVIVCAEDDDWYAPTHVATVVGRLARNADAWLSGDDEQRYYHLPQHVYRTFDNIGGCLCQTAFRREAIPQLIAAIDQCEAKRGYGVDTTFWQRILKSQWAISRAKTVVGIKGLPGQAGLGIGHRPDHQWQADQTGEVLARWIGADVSLYESLQAGVLVAS